VLLQSKVVTHTWGSLTPTLNLKEALDLSLNSPKKK